MWEKKTEVDLAFIGEKYTFHALRRRSFQKNINLLQQVQCKSEKAY